MTQPSQGREVIFTNVTRKSASHVQPQTTHHTNTAAIGFEYLKYDGISLLVFFVYLKYRGV